jgi:uncharacterized protein (DUF4415 family)
MPKDSPLTTAELNLIKRRRAAAKKRALAYADSISPAEEARLTAAAESDPDNPLVTEEDFQRFRPAHEVLPGLVAAHIRNKGGRPKSPAPKKVVTIRLDSDVVDQLKAGGAGWQTRVNSILRKAVGKTARG